MQQVNAFVVCGCRTCWEVACYDTDFQDGYGEWMHRSNACKDTGLSIKLKIVDRWLFGQGCEGSS